ncbi:kinase-like domain-containing protein [Favolaschia claudopus]|uniref:Kinase-like domain-containing protein n=1 Tax=Favolaschia claudopus TaxID=2862362 RepID=A0AAW0DCF1_9AGAR
MPLPYIRLVSLVIITVSIIAIFAMPSTEELKQAAADFLHSKGLQLVSFQVIQLLWAGYGYICRIQAIPTTLTTPQNKPISLILKHITPPPTSGTLTESHPRRLLSYQVEQSFYATLAPLMPPDIPIASCMSCNDSTTGSNTMLLLTDLKETYSIPGELHAELSSPQVYAALDWLAGFHAFWWGRVSDFDRASLCRPPLEHLRQHSGDRDLRCENVWLNGGYTYFATRRDEFRDLLQDETSEWAEALSAPIAGQASVAELVTHVLAPAKDRHNVSPYETLIHGDVKSENLFTTTNGTTAAFYDFQYVGLGLGVTDLAKLFTCSVPPAMLANRSSRGEDERGGREAIAKYEWAVFVRHWETAVVDWLRFQASWGFGGNKEWLEGRERAIIRDGGWRG